jgi:uncharacterized membrane protein YdjX (TVP38/TMEM64 family)
MSYLEPIWNFISTLGAYVIGTVVSSVVLGVMLDRFVIRKIFQNKKVKRLEGQIDKILDRLDTIIENGKKKD